MKNLLFWYLFNYVTNYVIRYFVVVGLLQIAFLKPSFRKLDSTYLGGVFGDYFLTSEKFSDQRIFENKQFLQTQNPANQKKSNYTKKSGNGELSKNSPKSFQFNVGRRKHPRIILGEIEIEIFHKIVFEKLNDSPSIDGSQGNLEKKAKYFFIIQISQFEMKKK